MKRLWIVLSIVLFFASVALALIGLGNYFISYISSQEHLSVETNSPQVLPLGTKTVFNLRGGGFNRKTTARLLMDVNNSEAIMGSVPLEGVFNDSLLYGDALYLVSSSGGIQVLDIKDPSQPRLIREYLDGRSIIDVYRNGKYLYLCCQSLGVSIMQIQQDGTLQHMTDIAVETLAVNCQVSHGYLFIAGGKSGLLVYDVREPRHPRLVQIVRAEFFVSKVMVFEEYLYLAGAENQIEIYQLTTPQKPVRVGTVQLTAKAYDLVVYQHHLYVAGEAGVSLYGLVHPQQPVLLQQWSDFGSARKLFPGLGHVYVADSFSGLRAVDIGTKTPSSYISLNVEPRILSEMPDFLYVAGHDKGVLVVDKSKLVQWQGVPTIDAPGSVYDLFIKDDWLYIAAARGGVLLHDLDDQSNDLKSVSSRWGESFAAGDGLLFVAQAKQGIEVLDITNPGNPESVAVWSHLESRRLAIQDHYLLSSNGGSGFDLIDFSDMQHPRIKHVLADVHVLDVTIEGGLIYIASKDEGLLVYELTDHEKLSRLSSLQTPFPMNRFDQAVTVKVHDGIAYVANGRSGLLIVDIRKSTKPKILGSLDIPGFCKTVTIAEDKAFVLSHHGGISIINIENPGKPELISSIAVPGLSRGLQVDDDLIYMAQRERGVVVLPMPVHAEKVKILSKQHMQVTLPSPRFPGSYSLQISNRQKSVVVDGAVTYQ